MQVSLATRIMVVNVSISVWEGRRLDRAITSKAIADNHVNDEDALRVNKLLVSKESMKEIMSASSAIRTFVREHTLPWKDNGDRVLLRQMYTKFVQEFHDLETEWWTAVNHFVDVKYPGEVAKASFRMGDAFNGDDYPHAEELRTKFRLSLDIDAIAEPDDFRVKLDDDTVNEIRGKIEDAMALRINAAMGDVWERVAKMVEHFADRTSPDIQRFHDTTVTNLQELVALLPGLNLLNDPDLKAMGHKVRDTLCGYDPKDLRKNPAVRAKARAEAQEIMDAMSGFMNAFKH